MAPSFSVQRDIPEKLLGLGEKLIEVIGSPLSGNGSHQALRHPHEVKHGHRHIGRPLKGGDVRLHLVMVLSPEIEILLTAFVQPCRHDLVQFSPGRFACHIVSLFTGQVPALAFWKSASACHRGQR